MLEEIQSRLERNAGLNREQTLLVGVSGGPDSLCLLDILHQLGYPLVVAHLDHQLRPGSAGEAESIERIARSLGAPFVCRKLDVSRHAREQAQSIEEAARNLRYAFLFEEAERLEAQAVAVGHNADDQTETVLMHFLRGSGLAGLGGMDFRSLPNPWSASIPLVRPLLGVRRGQILEYLSRRGLEPVFDESNQDVRYYRNRLRHELVPFLESLNPGVSRRICQTAEILRADDQVLNALTQDLWESARLHQDSRAVALDLETLTAQPLALQRRLLRRAIAALRPGLRDIDFQTVERLLVFLEQPTRSRQADLAAGLRVEIDSGRLWLAFWRAELPGEGLPRLEPASPRPVAVPGETRLCPGWRLRCEVLSASPARIDQALRNPDPWQAWLNLDALELPLEVRPRQPGDRFQPLGMAGHSIKLSDYLINQQMPRRSRPDWPLVAAGGRIAWIPGYTINDRFAVHPEVTRLLHLKLEKD